jgi:hypothetical protein
MPRGGARPGAGRPKKAPADKLISGNPGKRNLTVLKFSGNQSQNKKTKPRGQSHPPAYLDLAANEGGDDLPSATEIYKMLNEWIDGSGCADLVAQTLVEDFAFLRRSYLECEYMNKHYGRLANGKRSPFVGMALDYQKAMNTVYNQIWLIVSRNCVTKYEGEKNTFLELLQNRGF